MAWTWTARKFSHGKHALKSLALLKNPIDYLTLNLQKEKKILRTREGVRFEVRPQTPDRFEFSEAFLSRSYEEHGPYVGKTIVDIGANTGAFSVFAARAGAKRIVAVEPSPGDFVQFSRNAELNQGHQIELVNVAISDAHSLDHLVDQHHLNGIDILRIDCAGHEFEFLFKISNSTLKRVGKILLTYHNLSIEKNDFSLISHLQKKGFSLEFHSAGASSGLLRFTNPHLKIQTTSRSAA